MSTKSLGKLLCLVGCLLMGHAAFAMIQFRHYVRATGDELLSTPIDIILEALLALVLCMIGSSWWSGTYRPILSAPTFWSRRYDSLSSVDDFITFQHRGKAFAQWKLHESPVEASVGGKKAKKQQQEESVNETKEE